MTRKILTIPQELKARLKPLPECHEAYFVMDANTVLVAVDRLELTRLRWQGAINANELMRRAAKREIERRQPISVRRRADGSFDVVDGNSTVANAIRSGWRTIPAMISP